MDKFDVILACVDYACAHSKLQRSDLVDVEAKKLTATGALVVFFTYAAFTQYLLKEYSSLKNFLSIEGSKSKDPFKFEA